MMKRMIESICIVGILLFFFGSALAADVTFQWDTNNEPDLAGYRLWQSTVSGQYDQSQPPAFEVLLSDPEFDHTGDRCQWTLKDVPDGTYYWVMTAFDDNDPENESGFSNEVTAELDSTAPGSPGNVTVEVVVRVKVN